jgi:hypothetical protein
VIHALEFLVSRVERVLEEIGRMRDDTRIMAATIQRLEGRQRSSVSKEPCRGGSRCGIAVYAI